MKSVTGKREQNKQRRRCAMVEIATRSFLDHGYAATSMSAIADEVGGSKATLWSHFGSKEELFAAVIDDLVIQFAQQLEGTLTGEAFSVEGLRRYCLRFLDKLMGDDAISLFRLIMADGARFPEINAVFHIRGPARVQRLVTTFFATRFGADEAARLARITNSVLVGYRSHALTRPEGLDAGDREQFIDDFIAHLRLPEYAPASEHERG